MKRIKFILFSIILSIFLVTIVFFIVGFIKPKNAGILIETNVKSVVFLNGEQMGKTRYEATVVPGEMLVRLVPESSDRAYPTFEAKVNVASGIKTIIKHEFREDEDNSSGIIVSFEKAAETEVGLAVVTMPDSAEISIDDQVRGVSPYITSSLTAGDHALIVSTPGYVQRTENIRTYVGYKLTAVVKLAPNQDKEYIQPQTPTPTPSVKGTKKVEILETSTGYLRVRKEPTTLSDEVGQVLPGEIYSVLEEDKLSGWYKIEITRGKQGWVSGQYARITVIPDPTMTPTPSASASASPTPTAAATVNP